MNNQNKINVQKLKHCTIYYSRCMYGTGCLWLMSRTISTWKTSNSKDSSLMIHTAVSFGLQFVTFQRLHCLHLQGQAAQEDLRRII